MTTLASSCEKCVPGQNYQDQSANEPVEQVVIISINGVETEWFGDELTSPLTYAIEFLEGERDKGLEF